MSQSASFRVPNNLCNIVKENLSDQTSADLTLSQAPVSFEINQQANAYKDPACTKRSLLVIAELSEKTSFEQRLHLLPASVGRYLLHAADKGLCPPIPILRLLGFRTQAEIDEGRQAQNSLSAVLSGQKKGRMRAG